MALSDPVSVEEPSVEAKVETVIADANLSLLLDNGSPDYVESNHQKAAKNDDAPVPTVLWDRLLWTKLQPKVWSQAAEFARIRQVNPLDVLRNAFFLPLWRKRV